MANYYKMSLDEQFITELKKENIEVEQFQRYLKKQAILKKDEDLDLAKAKEEFIALQKNTAEKAEEFEASASPVSSSVRTANEKAFALREAKRAAALEASAKAQSYTGKFPEDKEAQTAILEKLQHELNQNSLNMHPADYAQKIAGEFIERLETLANGREAALETVKKIAEIFAKEANKLQAKEIDTLLFIKNCRTAIEENKSELTNPQTFSENLYFSVVNAIRLVLNLFDKFYTWLISAEKTKAETKDYTPVFAAPTTQLAREISIIEKELDGLEKDTKQTEAAMADRAEKIAAREERKDKRLELYGQQIQAAQNKAIERRLNSAQQQEEKKVEKRLAAEMNIDTKTERFNARVNQVIDERMAEIEESIETAIKPLLISTAFAGFFAGNAAQQARQNHPVPMEDNPRVEMVHPEEQAEGEEEVNIRFGNF